MSKKSEDYDRFAADDGSDWMRRLAPRRDELPRGDLRPLHPEWLCRASGGELREDTLEPEVPHGLWDLSPPRQALVEFLEIDLDVVAAAGPVVDLVSAAQGVSYIRSRG